jgi:SAM-dependent methyltransferase
MKAIATDRRTLLRGGAAAVSLALLAACAQLGVPSQPRPYKPMRGQSGKDVVWIPTPDNVVQRMLDMAQVSAADTVVDLGSGDGKIAIAAAKRGARARGIEFNPDMVALSKREAQAQGVNVQFEQGDIFKSNFADADVVTLYLLPELNQRLRPILLAMKPGTRVVSHEFDMNGWVPDGFDEVEGRKAYLWIVPAKVSGDWTVTIEGEPAMEVRLRQQYQRLDGQAARGGERVALQEPKVRGANLQFRVPAGETGALRFDGTVQDGTRMSGTATFADGRRKPFTAVRAPD